MDSKLKSDVENYKTQRNDMTAVQAQQKEQAFMQADKEIQMYSKKAEQMMAMKRQILLTPILRKIDTIIKAIGKEGNYSIIIDASMMNALLFATETDDITSLVGSRYEKR